MKQFRNLTMIILLAGMILAGCVPQAATSTPEVPGQLVVMTHDSFAVSEGVVEIFESINNAEVTFVSAGDTGSVLNQLLLAQGNPPADVFYGIDNTFLSRALEADLFVPYESPMLDLVPARFKLDPQNRALPVDYGDVCLNYEIAYFEDNGLAIPQTLDELLNPQYSGLLVVQNPATSSPGLAFLLATIAEYGDPGYLDYWKALVENDTLIVNDWETAYYNEFSLWGGTRPLVVSYSSSPPFEVIYSEAAVEKPSSAAITAPGMCFRQIEFVGILNGARNPELAQKWVDFMLSQPFQEDMPLQMFVFPVNPAAVLDERFVLFLDDASVPASLDPQEIAENREAWLQAWTEQILR